jgi:hypothetical protein
MLYRNVPVLLRRTSIRQAAVNLPMRNTYMCNAHDQVRPHWNVRMFPKGLFHVTIMRAHILILLRSPYHDRYLPTVQETSLAPEATATTCTWGRTLGTKGTTKRLRKFLRWGPFVSRVIGRGSMYSRHLKSQYSKFHQYHSVRALYLPKYRRLPDLQV